MLRSALLLVLCVPLAAQDPTLFPGARYAHDGFPLNADDVALPDFDGDGDLDLATLMVAGQSGLVSVRFNAGDGVLSAAVDSNCQPQNVPRHVGAADVDGDGDDEVWFVNFNSGSVSLLGHDGLGGTSCELIGVVAGIEFAAFVDIDDDEDLDLVATVFDEPGGVRVRANLGGGMWGGMTASATTGGPTTSLACGDLDGDGQVDALVGLTSGVALLKGGPHASFTNVDEVFLGASPASIALGDLDGDGDLDAAAINHAIDAVSLLRNDGGSFVLDHDVVLPIGPLDVLTEVVLADVGGDGALDLLVSENREGVVYACRGSGALGFGVAEAHAVGRGGQGLAAGDLDGDGALEVVAAAEFSGHAAVLRGDASGALGSAPVGEFQGIPAQFVSGEFTGDGFPDTLLLHTVNAPAILFRGDGKGGMHLPLEMPDLAISSPSDMLTADMNLDQVDDFVALKSVPSQLHIVRMDGFGGVLGSTTLTALANATSVAAGNLDGDNDVDLVLGGPLGIQVVRTGSPAGFNPQGLINPPHSVLDVELGDMDGDGNLDAVLLGNSGQLRVMYGDGATGFPDMQSMPTPPAAFELELGLMDGDEHLDVVLATDFGTYVALNDGSGEFPVSTLVSAAKLPELRVADFDGDGELDALGRSPDFHGVDVLLGDGSGGLGPLTSFAVEGKVQDIRLDDFDLDGRVDIAVLNFDEPTLDAVQVLLSDPEPAFAYLGNNLAGSEGLPLLEASGALLPFVPLALDLTNARASSGATLILGFGQLNAPFKGGVLVPTPDVVLGGFVTNGDGAIDLGTNWPANVPGGLEMVLQFWIVDPAGPKGLAASNGLRIAVPGGP